MKMHEFKKLLKHVKRDIQQAVMGVQIVNQKTAQKAKKKIIGPGRKTYGSWTWVRDMGRWVSIKGLFVGFFIIFHKRSSLKTTKSFFSLTTKYSPPEKKVEAVAGAAPTRWLAGWPTSRSSFFF